MLTSDEWEVGLVEMNVPSALDMVTKDEAWLEWITYDNYSEVATIATVNDVCQLAKHGCIFNFIDDHYEVTVPDGYCVSLSKPQCGLPELIYGDSDRIYYGEPIDKNSPIEGETLLYRATRNVTKYVFREGYYENMRDFFALIVKAVNNKLSLSYANDLTQLIKCELKDNGFIRFSDQLSNILGFRKQSVQQRINVALHSPDQFPGLNCILVFTNIIEEQFVGHEKAPLLRLLPIRTSLKKDEIMSYSCQPVQYKKVMQNEIMNIRILLTDDLDGSYLLPIVVEYLTLHFKCKQKNIFRLA